MRVPTRWLAVTLVLLTAGLVSWIALDATTMVELGIELRGGGGGMQPFRLSPEAIALADCEHHYRAAHAWRKQEGRFPSRLWQMEPRRLGVSVVQSDPWGGSYRIEPSARDVRVVSAGPDGLMGTDDDIAWPSER